jgi:hypothetical protein
VVVVRVEVLSPTFVRVRPVVPVRVLDLPVPVTLAPERLVEDVRGHAKRLPTRPAQSRATDRVDGTRRPASASFTPEIQVGQVGGAIRSLPALSSEL